MSSSSCSLYPPLLGEYVRLQKEAEGRWGNKTVLFMMVGSFYEVYEALVDRKTGETCGRATEMSRMCNIVLTKKNKAVEFSMTNPYMCGFPAYCRVRFVDKLTSCGYSVVISDQIMEKAGKMDRKITATCSPMVPASIVMSAEEEDAQYFSTKPSDQEGAQESMTDRIGFSIRMELGGSSTELQGSACSVVILNLTTGMVGLHETEWSSRDFLELMFMKHCPVEVVWSSGTRLVREHFIEAYPGIKHHTPEKVEVIYTEIPYQEKVLHKSFGDAQGMTIHESLELERFPLTTTNLVSFLDFVYQHFPMVIQKLQPPVWDVLSEGVDFLPHIFHELHLLRGKPSVLEIMDCTCTRMGKRRYRVQWFRPLSSVSRLRDLLLQQQRVLESGVSLDNGRSVLASLHDWESTLRSLSMGRYSLRRLLCLWRDLDALAACVVFPTASRKSALQLSRLLDKSFVRSAVEEHDWSVSMVSSAAPTSPTASSSDPKKAVPQQWVQEVAVLLGIQGFSSLSSLLKVLETGSDGAGICLQFRPSKNVDKKPETLLPSPYTTRKMSGGAVRIFHPEWTAWWTQQRAMDLDIENTHREEFRAKAAEWSHTNLEATRQLMEQVIEIDILWSRVTAAKKHNLTLPVFLDDHHAEEDTSIKGLRNPIVEAVDPRRSFVTNDFCLDPGHKGVLLFGQNSSGKSTFVKSLGINIWLAQTGHLVFCEQMRLRPYRSLLTKLCVQDDIFRGQSTFVNEMLDLRYILRRCRDAEGGGKILVLADELTAGTETWSATAIVASTLLEFLRAPPVTFVMTTHLHTIHLFKELYADPGLCVRHVHFSRVGVTDPQFRKILPGEGPVMYGIEVAEDLGFPADFIARCFHYRESMDRHTRRQSMEPLAVALVPKKKSRYSKHKIVDCCEACGTTHDLETHHVVPQAVAVPSPVSGNPVIPDSAGTSVHNPSNLRVLCRTCHDKEHHHAPPPRHFQGDA